MKIDIRPLQMDDAYTSYKWRNDKEVFKYTGSTYDKEIRLEDELNWMKKIMNETNSLRCAILADDVYVGNIYLTDIEDGIGQYHVFVGDRSYWGKGISHRASELLLEKGKAEFGLHKVYSYVKTINTASVKLHLKLGFVIKKEVDESYYLEILLQ